MKIFSKAASVLLAAALVFSMAACHPKNEVAMTIGDVDITSAFYMCSLINADMEGRSKVDEAKSAEKEKSEDAEDTAAEDTAEATDYYKEKIDGKSFEAWVKETALKNCKQYAAYVTLCKENKIELDKDATAEIDNYVDYYWSYYGYSTLYEPNGVAKSTFRKSVEVSYLASKYFESLYAEGGSKAVPEDEIKTAIDDNFVIADTLTVSFAEKTDEEKTEIMTKFADYEKRLNNGESFDAIYEEQNGAPEETAETDTEEKKPQNKYAQLYGSEDTDYANDNYSTVRDMGMGEVKVVNGADDITILVKRDIMADSYWLDNLNSATLSLLKQDEFDKDIEKYADGLKMKKNESAIKRFKVKKIVYPEAQQ